MHIGTWKVTYLDQEKEVGVLACWSSAGALLDVVLGNVYTLLATRWCENSSETDSFRVLSPCCLEIVGAVSVVDGKSGLRLIMNCAVTLKCVSGRSLKFRPTPLLNLAVVVDSLLSTPTMVSAVN